MNDLVAELEASGEARGQTPGEARGLAQGRIRIMLELVIDGEYGAEAACRRFRQWLEQGEITQEQHRAAEARLESLV